jgi:hypothetical protein
MKRVSSPFRLMGWASKIGLQRRLASAHACVPTTHENINASASCFIAGPSKRHGCCKSNGLQGKWVFSRPQYPEWWRSRGPRGLSLPHGTPSTEWVKLGWNVTQHPSSNDKDHAHSKRQQAAIEPPGMIDIHIRELVLLVAEAVVLGLIPAP